MKDFFRNNGVLILIAAILLALVVGGLVILISGNNPVQGYATIVEGALGKTSGIRQTVKNFIPLLGAALAIAPCFKMKFWNIGAEGQILAGGIAVIADPDLRGIALHQARLLLGQRAAGKADQVDVAPAGLKIVHRHRSVEVERLHAAFQKVADALAHPRNRPLHGSPTFPVPSATRPLSSSSCTRQKSFRHSGQRPAAACPR